MTRRFGNTSIQNINQSAGVGTNVLISPQSNIILSLGRLCVAGVGSGNATVDFRLATSGPVFLSMAVNSFGTESVDLNCYELPKSSGVAITVGGAPISATAFYTQYDESPGITKIASRAASFQASNGAKAVRRPGVRGIGDLS